MRTGLVVAGTVTALAAAAAGVALAGPRSAPGADLPVLFDTPPFQLTDQTGSEFDSRALAGGVWVVDFIYTTCPDVCPTLTANLARLRNDLRTEGLLGDRVRFVSISVDPAHDDPAALREFASHYGVQGPATWAFLTGDADRVGPLLFDGFHISVQPASPAAAHAGADGSGPITHTAQVLLVDADGRVRGVYSGVRPENVTKLGQDIRALLH